MTAGTTDQRTACNDCPKGGRRCKDFEITHEGLGAAGIRLSLIRNLANDAKDGLVRSEDLRKVLECERPGK